MTHMPTEAIAVAIMDALTAVETVNLCSVNTALPFQ